MRKHHAALATAHAQCGLTLLQRDTQEASSTDFCVKLTVIKKKYMFLIRTKWDILVSLALEMLV